MPRTAEYLERGRTFGRWTVLNDLPYPEYGGHRLYRCRCQCGTYRTVRGASLRSGVSTSCGQWCGRDADAMRELAPSANHQSMPKLAVASGAAAHDVAQTRESPRNWSSEGL
jgi:hypothetical protein